MTDKNDTKVLKAGAERATLYINDEDWASLVKLIKQSSGTKDAKTKERIRFWLESLPESIKFRDSHLLWINVSLSPAVVHQASKFFSQHFQFEFDNKNYNSAFLLWTEYANLKFYYLDRFANITGWLQKADKLLNIESLPAQNEIRASFCVAYFNAILLAKPSLKMLIKWSNILLNELPKLENINIKKSIYNHLILYNIWIGDMKNARLLKKESSIIVSDDVIYPFNTLMQSTMFSMVDWLSLRVADAEKEICIGIKYGEETQIKVWEAQILSQHVYTYICLGDFLKAKKLLLDVENHKDNSQLLDNSQYHYLMGWLNLSEENYGDAESHLVRALELSREAGVLFTEAVIRICLAQVYFSQDNLLDAVKHLAKTQWIGRKLGSKHIRYGGLLAQSWVMHSWGKEKISSLYLRRALKLASEEQYIVIPGWPHKVMPSLLEKALHENIEIEYVKMLISAHKITPTGKYPVHQAWPWQVELVFLPELEIKIQGEIQKTEGKLQKKSLELIQLLTFYSEGLLKTRIADLLYPDKDADKALKALDSTIFRARKIIHDKKSIVSLNGKYSLNSQSFHCNIMSLNEILETEDHKTSKRKTFQQFNKVRNHLDNALSMGDYYQEIMWLSSEITSIKEASIRYLSKCTSILSGAKKIEVLSYILYLDETVELSYQALIIAYQELNRTDKAYEVFLQCESTFLRLYGLSPSIKTQKLLKTSNP